MPLVVEKTKRDNISMSCGSVQNHNVHKFSKERVSRGNEVSYLVTFLGNSKLYNDR